MSDEVFKDICECGNDACFGEYDHEREARYQAYMKDHYGIEDPKFQNAVWATFSYAFDIGYNKGQEAS